MLLAEERAWFDAYHARVKAELAPELKGEDEVLAWLDGVCAPLV